MIPEQQELGIDGNKKKKNFFLTGRNLRRQPTTVAGIGFRKKGKKRKEKKHITMASPWTEKGAPISFLVHIHKYLWQNQRLVNQKSSVFNQK